MDTHKSLGQWLTEIPAPTIDSDCCWIGPRVAVSPNGQKVALIVVDKIEGTRDERFTFSIHLFDVSTEKLTFFGEEISLVWSPDSAHIAFVKDPTQTEGLLWMADLENDRVSPLIKRDADNPGLSFGQWEWSSDSKQIAYRLHEGIAEQAEIWIADISSPTSSAVVVDLPMDFFPFGFVWVPDGERLLGNVPDLTAPKTPADLWVVSIKADKRERLTQGLNVIFRPLVS